MFLYFNYRSPDAVNLRTMIKKALFKEYETLNDVYNDFHLMMLPLNSPNIKGRRKRYGQLFEEAACYLMGPTAHIHMLKVLLDSIQGNEKYSLVFKHLMKPFVNGRYVDADLEHLNPRVKLAAEYALKKSKYEKKMPLPDFGMVEQLCHRRNIKENSR